MILQSGLFLFSTSCSHHSLHCSSFPFFSSCPLSFGNIWSKHPVDQPPRPTCHPLLHLYLQPASWKDWALQNASLFSSLRDFWKLLWSECHQILSLLLLLFSRSVVSDSSATPGTIACQTPLSVGFSTQEYWSGLPAIWVGFLLQRGLPDLHRQEDSLPLSHQGSPTFFQPNPKAFSSLFIFLETSTPL